MMQENQTTKQMYVAFRVGIDRLDCVISLLTDSKFVKTVNKVIKGLLNEGKFINNCK